MRNRKRSGGKPATVKVTYVMTRELIMMITTMAKMITKTTITIY